MAAHQPPSSHTPPSTPFLPSINRPTFVQWLSYLQSVDPTVNLQVATQPGILHNTGLGQIIHLACGLLRVLGMTISSVIFAFARCSLCGRWRGKFGHCEPVVLCMFYLRDDVELNKPVATLVLRDCVIVRLIQSIIFLVRIIFDEL
jgi:hypothetical protein